MMAFRGGAPRSRFCFARGGFNANCFAMRRSFFFAKPVLRVPRGPIHLVVIAIALNLLFTIQTMNAAERSPGSGTNQSQFATLVGVCFWCLEALYETIDASN